MSRLNNDQIKKVIETIIQQLKQKGIDVGGGAVVKIKDDGSIEGIEGFGSINPSSFSKEQILSMLPKDVADRARQAEQQKIQDMASLIPSDFAKKVRNMPQKEYESQKESLKEELKTLITELTKRMQGSGLTVTAKDDNKTQETSSDKDDDNCTCSSCLTYDNFETRLSKNPGIFEYAEVVLNKKKFKIKYYANNSGEENIVMKDCSEDIDIENSSNEELQLMLQEAVTDRKFDKAQAVLNAIQERKNKSQ